MPAKGTRQGKLTLEDFKLDEQGLVIRCPMGQSPVETSVAEVRLQGICPVNSCGSDAGSGPVGVRAVTEGERMKEPGRA